MGGQWGGQTGIREFDWCSGVFNGAYTQQRISRSRASEQYIGSQTKLTDARCRVVLAL